MEANSLFRDIGSLPPEAQRQVSDFVAFLKQRYSGAPIARRVRRAQLSDEPFIGMWRDREDMKDSSAWVRRVRESEWERAQ